MEEMQCPLSEGEGNIGERRIILRASFLQVIVTSSERAAEPTAVQYTGFIHP